MKVMVLGGDGFCGWPTALHLSKKGHDIVIVDNLSRRNIDIELECESLTPIQPMSTRLNLLPKLLAAGKKVKVFDNLSRGSASYLAGMDVEIVQGDVRDIEAAARALAGVQSVIHLAAFGSVVESIRNPEENFDINARGTLTMLRASVAAGVGKFIFASTGGALIGNAVPPVSENSVPKPISPYGASKLCGEAYCSAFAASYGIETVRLRFANVYGPYSAHKRGAITLFINALRSGDPIVIYGDGSASRDLLYVDDICDGICAGLTTSLPAGSVFHLASGVETTVRNLAQALKEIAGRPDHPVQYEPRRAGEVDRNFASFDLAQAKLGFAPKVELGKGLVRTWQWFLDQEPASLAMPTTDS